LPQRKPLGLPNKDAESLLPLELAERLRKVDEQYRQAGAHYTLRSAAEMLPLVDQINSKLAQGILP
jgi:phosphonoacetaldehyde hydrolase